MESTTVDRSSAARKAWATRRANGTAPAPRPRRSVDPVRSAAARRAWVTMRTPGRPAVKAPRLTSRGSGDWLKSAPAFLASLRNWDSQYDDVWPSYPPVAVGPLLADVE